jgi:hypothetical protein
MSSRPTFHDKCIKSYISTTTRTSSGVQHGPLAYEGTNGPGKLVRAASRCAQGGVAIRLWIIPFAQDRQACLHGSDLRLLLRDNLLSEATYERVFAVKEDKTRHLDRPGVMRDHGCEEINIVTAVVAGALLANSSFSVSAPRVVVLVGEATVSPFAMMMNAPLSLPMQQYDSY